MFNKHGQVHLRFNKIEHSGMKRDDTDIDLVTVHLELSPLTPALATDLSKGTIYLTPSYF